jgi:hypothetical protein
MARRDATREALDQLRVAAANPASGEGQAELARALRGRLHLAVARAADIVGQAQLAVFEPMLVEAFDRLLRAGTSADRGCLAKTALVAALNELELRSESSYLAGRTYVQLESGYAGSSDSAGELRGWCGVGLARCNHPEILLFLADLLGDSDVQARILAARGLAFHGDPAGAGLLRLKLLLPESEPSVSAECLSSLLQLSPHAGLTFVSERLFRHPTLRESALLAVGDSRLPEGLALLEREWKLEWSAEGRHTLLTAIALTRLPQSVDFLLEKMAESDTAEEARGALQRMYPSDAAVQDRITRSRYPG